jgi:hypothetical protein
MPTSANPKSQPGTSGPEDSSQTLENSLSSENQEKKESPKSSTKRVAKAVEESDGSPKARPGFRTDTAILTEADRKILRLMSSSISERIGFDPNSPSRSVRV